MINFFQSKIIFWWLTIDLVDPFLDFFVGFLFQVYRLSLNGGFLVRVFFLPILQPPSHRPLCTYLSISLSQDPSLIPESSVWTQVLLWHFRTPFSRWHSDHCRSNHENRQEHGSDTACEQYLCHPAFSDLEHVRGKNTQLVVNNILGSFLMSRAALHQPQTSRSFALVPFFAWSNFSLSPPLW